jgi:hypothetical protein
MGFPYIHNHPRITAQESAQSTPGSVIGAVGVEGGNDEEEEEEEEYVM